MSLCWTLLGLMGDRVATRISLPAMLRSRPRKVGLSDSTSSSSPSFSWADAWGKYEKGEKESPQAISTLTFVVFWVASSQIRWALECHVATSLMYRARTKKTNTLKPETVSLGASGTSSGVQASPPHSRQMVLAMAGCPGTKRSIA